MGGEFLLIWVAVGLLLSIVAVFRGVYLARLANEYEAFAREHDFEYVIKPPRGPSFVNGRPTEYNRFISFMGMAPGVRARVPDPWLFLQQYAGCGDVCSGGSEWITALMGKRIDGIDCYLFNVVREEVDSDGNRSQTSKSVASVRVPYTLPAMKIRPENVLTRIAEKMGAQDIQFEWDEFNRRYSVQCQDPKHAFKVLSPQMLEFLMAMPDKSWEISGTRIAIVRPHVFKTEEAFADLSAIVNFVQRLPDLAKKDYGLQPTWTSLWEVSF